MISDRPLHVILYTDSAGIGGAEISLGHLVATLPAEIQATVVGVSDRVVHAIADRHTPTRKIVLPAVGIRAFLAHLFTFQRLQPDIIHLNLCTPWAGAIGLLAALALPRVRVVRVDQLPLRTTDAWQLWRTRWLSLRVDAHVAVGEASARRMEDFYALGRNSVISIPNGVPDLALSPPVGHPSSTKLVVGSMGRLDAMKGHDILLRAVAHVEGVEAIILGEGSERSTLEKLATELGIVDRVHFPGWIEHPQTYLPQFDVVAMPSRSEGFPLAMVEAMLAARPVIATRVGSMPEAILDQKTGILIEKNDVLGLARALGELRDDPAHRLLLGKQAREMAVARFTTEVMAGQYQSLWKQLTTLPRKPRLRVPRPKD